MRQYLNLVREVLKNGVESNNRTGIKAKSIFGTRMEFDLRAGFPIVTAKYTSFRLIKSELLWFIGGVCDRRELQADDNHIWDEWTAPNPLHEGDMGPIYGVQWRGWKKYTGGDVVLIDQLAGIIEEIKTNPSSRRLIVSAWNVAELDEMALQPCHVMFQFSVQNGLLSCQIYQRSCDLFLGVPFNVASYALLTHIVANITGLGVGKLVWVGGDTHLYENHYEQAELMLSRDTYPLPKLCIDWKIDSIDKVDQVPIYLGNYKYHPAIKAVVAI